MAVLSNDSCLQICEYDVMCKAYTAWSRKFNEHVYDGWRMRSSKMLQIRYSDSNEQQLYLRDESLFCIIDQTQVRIVTYHVKTCDESLLRVCSPYSGFLLRHTA